MIDDLLLLAAEPALAVVGALNAIENLLIFAADHPVAVIGALSSVTGLLLISLAAVFRKAGRPMWAALIPVYSAVVLFQIAGRPGWWAALLLVPIVGLGALVVAMVDLAQRFGRTPAYGVGLACFTLVFLPMLAASDSTYAR